jgi:hypothetical protein
MSFLSDWWHDNIAPERPSDPLDHAIAHNEARGDKVPQSWYDQQAARDQDDNKDSDRGWFW